MAIKFVPLRARIIRFYKCVFFLATGSLKLIYILYCDRAVIITIRN
jgi:hypothetical protein